MSCGSFCEARNTSFLVPVFSWEFGWTIGAGNGGVPGQDNARVLPKIGRILKIMIGLLNDSGGTGFASLSHPVVMSPVFRLLM